MFTSADDNKLVVPQFLTRYGLQSYFVKQRDELVELTAMDSWVLNLTRSVKYSDADRAEIQRQLTEQYISDYTATWRAGMDNLNIRNFESIGQLTGALEQVISGDQPLQRALTVLRDNTQPGVFSEKLSAKEREEALQSRITSYSPASGTQSPGKQYPGSTERQRKHDAGRVSATHRVAPLPAGNPERACTREIGAESRAVTA